MRITVLLIALVVVGVLATTVVARDEAPLTLAALEARVAAQDKRIAALEEKLTDKGFAAAMERAENLRRKERAEARARSMLTRSGVTLTPEQETAVLAAYETYQSGIREVWANARGGGSEAREAVRKILELRKEDLRLRLVGIVGETDAEKLLGVLVRRTR